MQEFSIYIVAVNMVICIATVIGNILILAAVITTPRLHTPSNILLCNLATADLGVGLVTLPLFMTAQLCEKTVALEASLNLSVLVFAGVSMAGMTLISVDRYFALWLHLRYRSIVTVSRSLKVVILLWVEAGIVIIIYFLYLRLIPLIGTLGAMFCFVISTVAYLRIGCIVRRHKRQIKDQSQSIRPGLHSGPLPKHGKSIKTMYLVNGLFVMSWVPLVALIISRPKLHSTIGKQGYQHLEQGAITFFLSNSAANPILYCWRMSQIRQAVKKVLRKVNKSMKCKK